LLGWYTPIVIVFVSLFFFGIERIGSEIQDPFGYDENDLPMYAIIETTQVDMSSLCKTYLLDFQARNNPFPTQ
jgi:predicted membrane chloride channel (bestrophin family)